MKCSRNTDRVTPAPGEAYPHSAYPAANTGRENGHGNFANMTEAAQAGNPFPSYPAKDSPQAVSPNMPRNGQNTPPPMSPSAHESETGDMTGRQMQNGAKNTPARPIITESYAPYLGYMPHNGGQQPMHPASPAVNSHKSAPYADRISQHSENRADKNSNTVRTFETIQGGHSAPDGNMHNNPPRNAPLSGETDIAPAQTRQQNYQNRSEQIPGSNFDLAPRNSANGFAKVNPPEENDFDKILQDELLRAPNGIKFPSSQKK